MINFNKALTCGDVADSVMDITNNYNMGLIDPIEYITQLESVVESKKREFAEVVKELDKVLKPKAK